MCYLVTVQNSIKMKRQTVQIYLLTTMKVQLVANLSANGQLILAAQSNAYQAPQEISGMGFAKAIECGNVIMGLTTYQMFAPMMKEVLDTLEALDEVRREAWREAYNEANKAAKEHPRKKGRPKADDKDAAIVAAAKAKADEIKNSAYALGKAPEHLTEKQQLRIEMIANSDRRLYRAYLMKEKLRLLLKIKDPDEAEEELKRWLW